MVGFEPRTYWEGRLAAAPGVEGVGFARLGPSFNRWMYRLQGDVFRERVARALDVGGADVLDVGSGQGFFVDLWRELGARSIVGLDITSVAVERLRAHYPSARFERVDVGSERVPLDDASVDAASAISVLYHLVDDAALEHAVGEVARVLRPGGTFVFSENFVRRPATRTREHYRDRTLAQYERLLDANGLVPVERRPFFVLMNAPADSVNPLRRAVWLGIGGIASLADPVGNALGVALYPLERQLVRRKRESASTELMICRKR